MHGESIKLCAVLCSVRRGKAGAETREAVRSAEERVSDPDWMPGMLQPSGPVPPEPPGVFTPDMHTHNSGAVASRMLRKAADIVSGDRNATHGDKERSFAAIADNWTAYLRSRREPNGVIRPHDVAHMMVLMKQQRAEWGLAVADHWIDQAGYAAIAGELTGAK